MNKRILLKLAVMVVVASVALVTQASVVVGFSECQAVPSYSQAQMDAIGQLNFYFAHASVGGNMMSGLAALHAGNAGFYKLTGQSDDATPPGSTQAGLIYDYARGNPGWEAKITDFTTFVNNGWHSPSVSVAINKFCYIDEAANVNTYISSMSALESFYPGTRFVYMTLPLTDLEDYAAYQRQLFNATLRQWVNANDRVLFDIADIEAHDLLGQEQTFLYDATTCQKLYSGYSSDHGHLTSGGSAELVALGFYALGNELVAVPEPASVGFLTGLGCLATAWIIRQRRR